MTLTRRDLLKNSALTGASIAAGSVFSGLALGGVAAAGPMGYGPLVSDPAGLLDLPEGFRYRVLAKGGSGYASGFTTYDDGQKFAGDADGAASFAIGGNRTVIVLNHELSTSELGERVPTTFGGRPVPTYDSAVAGGTSNIVLDRLNRVSSVYPSLAGTFNNCAGGPTPWGTWLTCEETQNTVNGVPHGYIFEVDPLGKLTTGQPYKGMGRFPHEAVGIDPLTGIAYMTEDHNNGLLYRFVPTDNSMEYGSLGNGGTVAAMKAEGLLRLGEVKTIGTTVRVSWVDVPGGNADIVNLNQAWTNDQVTRSRKLEGCWFGADGTYYFTSADESMAGIEHHGQVWALDPANDMITLVAYIPVDHPTFDRPDNVTVMPWGQLLLCEDGNDEQYLVGCEPSNGALWAFARNASGNNEFAGANFSPDGKTLFVSVQNPSTTFAITGPWGAVRS